MNAENEFLEAYDKHSKAVLRHVYFRVSDWETAQDITQETFFRSWNYVASGEKEVRSFKTFFYSVANNLIIDHYRQKPRAPLPLEEIKAEPSYPADQERQAERGISADLAKKLLSELDDEAREIIIYRYIDELSPGEVADITGKTPNNISVITHRGLKKLREAFIKYNVREI